jgi:DNA (cytosine-5-)-methyltransferase
MTQANKHGSYNFIDLFAGAGGLSEGFIQAGFYPVAHVEMNEHAAKTLETRSAYYHLKSIDKLDFYRQYLSGRISRAEFTQMIPDSVTNTVINETLSNETIPYVFDTIDVIMRTRGIEKIDVIVGGPPCQAYSLVGRAQSSHMGTPMRDDPRNYLYKLYAQFLEKYRPRMFVFENVLGIASAQGGSIWIELQETLKQVGYEIECHAQNAQNFGVLQNRRRMIIVGWLKNSGLAYPDFVVKKANAIVNDLFTDLPKLYPGESNNNYSEEKPSQYVMETGIRTADDILTLQICRPNIARDITIYKRAIELWNKGHQRLNYNDLPEELKTHRNRHSFIDRFKVVEGDESCCHTVLAHLSKDGHYFIHPDIDQHRSITVREAARIQSFPDSYYFEGPRTSQFMQIGNAVPPLMARGIAEGVFSQLHGGVNGQ